MRPDYERFLDEGGRQEFLKFAAEFDAPAFLRRAQHTSQVSEGVFEQCVQARNRMLDLPKKRLGILAAVIADDWSQLDGMLKTVKAIKNSPIQRNRTSRNLAAACDALPSDEVAQDSMVQPTAMQDELERGWRVEAWSSDYLAELNHRWQPKLRVEVRASKSTRRIRQATHELATAFVFFNRKWHRFVGQFDLKPVNEVRRDYNDYYVVEKACAFDSEKIGQAGFKPLSPITVADILARFPPLRCPLNSLPIEY